MKKEEWSIDLAIVQVGDKWSDLKKFFSDRLWVITGEMLTLSWLPQSILAIIQKAHNFLTLPERLLYLQGLKKQIEAELCPDVLGLNLIWGKPLYTAGVLTASHLQVLGKDPFLRNMLQRVLECDAGQKVPIIILASDKESELLKEAFKVLSDKAAGEPHLFCHYAGSQTEKAFDWSDFFKMGEHRFIYVKLNQEDFTLDRQILLVLEKEITKGFDSRRASLAGMNHPLIYVFQPELLEHGYSITQYAKKLRDHATFRIFSKEALMFGQDESSLLFGPDHSSQETCEDMREHCYQQFRRKRKQEEQSFLGASETTEDLKSIKVFADRIPVNQTAFGCFKIGEAAYQYAWFDPVRQGLGKKSWVRTGQMPVIQMSRTVSIKAKLPLEDPIALKIIEDLKSI